MLIDLIIDRMESENENGLDLYEPNNFYFDLMGYGGTCDDITRAMDTGTEEDVIKLLCDYVLNNGYKPSICEYIKRKSWIFMCQDLEFYKTVRGYVIRKPNGRFSSYVQSFRNGVYTWASDKTYARAFSYRTAKKHFEQLKKQGF